MRRVLEILAVVLFVAGLALAIVVFSGCSSVNHTSMFGTMAINPKDFDVTLEASGMNFNPNPSWMTQALKTVGLGAATFVNPTVGIVAASGDIATNLVGIARPNETGITRVYIKGKIKQVVASKSGTGYQPTEPEKGTWINGIWMIFYAPTPGAGDEPTEAPMPPAPSPTPVP